ncbi:uncharacterized protein BYT42DRAFT_546496 [Radiomyces spectabilis]|uniref:uncharacterized protein n=1 Tax=Radiomyces spectabilis TaxID=64574 RepID=UPI00221F6211|nr:uncharacterized protein BYT42DRAFT_546496 [Radiomyces spectabilis]KAI8377875.1 hypothetical protein BYT42DRAFT_546496 [Radiomyces spectabilis]
MSAFKPKTPIGPDTYAVIMPGVTSKTQALAERLLSKNHQEFHIFFNEKKFHNHLTHHLLAAYSLGATPERLQEIYDSHASFQRHLTPPQGESLTRENYQSALGKADEYVRFLRLFTEEIQSHGVVDTVRRWVWSGDMLARTVGGAFHPIIHIGYGLEFDLAGQVAEGLALAAVTNSTFSPIIPGYESVKTKSFLIPKQAASVAATASSSAMDMVSHLTTQMSTQLGFGSKSSGSESEKTASLQDHIESNSIMKIVRAMQQDSAFDGVVNFDDSNKLGNVLADEKCVSKLKEYLAQWKVEENAKDVQTKYKDLYTAAVIIYGASGMREGKVKLDFFLMHGVTSSSFIQHVLPYVTPSEGAALLRAEAAALLGLYVARGRPSLQIDLLLNYKSPNCSTDSHNPWLTVIDKSLDCKEEHVIKTVRACALGQIRWGDCEDDDLSKIWLHGAQVAVDQNGVWDRKGLGFIETWED